MKRSSSTERAIKLARDPRRNLSPTSVNSQHRMKWSTVNVAGSEIPQIKGHTAVMIKKKLILFGGYDGIRNRNSVHVLDTATWVWESNVACTGAIPTQRNGHTATPVYHCMYIIGGWLGNGPFASKSMHVLNTRSFEWLVPPTTGTPPGPCNMHSTDYIPELGIILVFRGGDGAKYLNDLHCLNLRTSNWSCLEATGEAPTPRANHGSSTVGRRLFIFGGWDGQKRLNDMHCFEVGPNTWSKVSCHGIPPTPRTGMTMVNIRDKLYVFGGTGMKSSFDDLQIFDSRTSTWELMATKCSRSDTDTRGPSFGRQRGRSASPRQNSRSPPWQSHDRARAASTGSLNVMEVESSSSSSMFGHDPDCADAASCPNDEEGDKSSGGTLVILEGQGPGPRSGHSATVMGRRLLIFGGSSALNYAKNLLMLDTDPPPTVHTPTSSCCDMIQSRMTHFYNRREMSDVIFTDANGTHSIHAHRILLALQSERFRAMFSLGFREKTENKIAVPSDVNFQTFCRMLQFLYSGELPPVIQSWSKLPARNEPGAAHGKRMRFAVPEQNVDAIRGALDLMCVADQFMIQHLKERCEVALSGLLRSKIISAQDLMSAAVSANAEQLIALCRHHIRNRNRKRKG